MKLKINMKNIGGEYDPPFSKSTMHRALFAAMLNHGKSKIYNITLCDDVLATLSILEACNCKIKINEFVVTIDSTNLAKPTKPLNCLESASTLRMALIICTYLFKEVDFLLKESLVKRPINGYGDYIILEKNDNIVKAKFNHLPKIVKIDGSLSSQYITGLILIAPVAKIEKIVIENEVVSQGYIELTKDVVYSFGIDAKIKENEIYISNEYIDEVEYYNEIDESSKAFFDVLKALGADVEPTNVNIETSQPDSYINYIIKNKPKEIDIDKCPDLLPIVVVLSCFSDRETKIINAYRTTIKESNRMVNIKKELVKLGAQIEIKGFEMTIKPIDKFNNDIEVESCNDHRIEMALAIAAYKCDEITIKNAGTNKKSFPEFYEILNQLNAKIEVVK